MLSVKLTHPRYCDRTTKIFKCGRFWSTSQLKKRCKQ